jgi:hypothetical protein
MSVVPFPRARALHAGLNSEKTLRRCRLAARRVGCGGALIQTVERSAARMLERGIDSETVIKAAVSTAQALLREQPGTRA